MSNIRNLGTRDWCPLVLVLVAAVGAVADTPLGTPYGCGDIDQAQIRSHLLAIARRTFDSEHGLAEHAISGSVATWWTQLGGDLVVTEAVASARRQVLADLGPWEAFKSGLDPDLATEVSVRLGTYAVLNRAFQTLLEEIAVRAADDLTIALESAAAAAANGMSECLAQYANTNWPRSVVELYQHHLAALGATSWPVSGKTKLTVGDLTLAHHTAVLGVGTIIASQVAARLLPIVLSKAVGKVVTTMVPVAGWVIGGSLIVLDVVRMKEGAISIASQSLTSPSHLAEIRSSLSEQILHEIRVMSPQTSLAVADKWYQAYRSFLDRWAFIVSWSRRSERFKRMVDLTDPKDLPRLADLMAILSRSISEIEISNSIGSGEIEILLRLGDGALQILDMTGDPQATLSWGSLSGMHLSRVADAFLPTISTPSDFQNRDELVSVLNLELDPNRLRRLLALDLEERSFLLNRASTDVLEILEITAAMELTWVLPLLTELPIEDGNTLARRILMTPDILRKIDPNTVRALAERNQDIERYLDRIERGERGPLADALTMLLDGHSSRASLPIRAPNQETIVFLGIVILAPFAIRRIVWRRRRQR